MKAMLEVCTPTSISYSGTSASITADGGVEFTGVTSLSLNGVFTSDYDNYVISVRNSTSYAGSAGIYFKLNSGGVNTTDSNYAWQMLLANSTSVTGFRSTSESSARYATVDDDAPTGDTLYLYGPYLSQPTAYRNIAIHSNSGAQLPDFAGTHSTSSSYDGISIIPDAGSLTGLVTVFGFTQ